MNTSYKQGLAALFATALALGCGSDQQQPAKEPSASTQTSYSSTETTSASQAAAPTPQQPQQAPAAGGPQDTEPTSNVTTMPATMDTNVTTLSDGEIFAIESAINKGAITLAELAKKKAASGEVKNFAAMALTHHRDAQNKVSAITAKEKVVTNPNDVAKKLESDVSSTAGDLKEKKGREFDTAYIDSQVKMHREGGSLIDTQLLPSVKSAALRDQLTTFRQTISTHLTKAEEIQSHLSAVGTTSAGAGTTEAGSEKAKGGTTTKPTTAPKQKPIE